jgi:hypothetical protein
VKQLYGTEFLPLKRLQRNHLSGNTNLSSMFMRPLLIWIILHSALTRPRRIWFQYKDRIHVPASDAKYARASTSNHQGSSQKEYDPVQHMDIYLVGLKRLEHHRPPSDTKSRSLLTQTWYSLARQKLNVNFFGAWVIKLKTAPYVSNIFELIGLSYLKRREHLRGYYFSICSRRSMKQEVVFATRLILFIAR